MFQNPLRYQDSQASDPFFDLGVNVQPVEADFAATANPFYHLFKPCSTTNNQVNPEQHFVRPHAVSGYERADGVYVDGYWRDGDGDTSQDLQVEDGGGYWQTNPDGNPFNNFG